MGIIDYILIAAILIAASYLLYCSFKKGRCNCEGCSINSCSERMDGKKRNKELSKQSSKYM